MGAELSCVVAWSVYRLAQAQVRKAAEVGDLSSGEDSRLRGGWSPAKATSKRQAEGWEQVQQQPASPGRGSWEQQGRLGRLGERRAAVSVSLDLDIRWRREGSGHGAACSPPELDRKENRVELVELHSSLSQQGGCSTGAGELGSPEGENQVQGVCRSWGSRGGELWPAPAIRGTVVW